MSEIKNQDRILEAIDQLRRRKARPDIERICNFLQRRFAVDPQDTVADLERLVDAEIVIKVEYKGNTSYRNAAKWSRYALYKNKPEAPNIVMLNSERTSSLLSSAVAEIIVEEPDYLETGVPYGEIEKHMQNKDSVRFAKKYLDLILQRELNSGNLQKMENGNYTLNTSAAAEAKNENKQDERAESANANCVGEAQNSANLGFRIGVRRKRAKKVFDPSDNHVPRKRGRPVGSTKRNQELAAQAAAAAAATTLQAAPAVGDQSPLPSTPTRAKEKDSCVYCHQVTNRRGLLEKLLSCKDCNTKAHPSCLEFGEDLVVRSRLTPWQCMECKTCTICNESSDLDSMLFCDGCDKAYHMYCHAPIIQDRPQEKWLCYRCLMVRSNFIPSVNGVGGLPTPRESPVPDSNLTMDIDEGIPDASAWTADDVQLYFQEHGFKEQALVFKDQEIDGKSLLLMKRNDVLTGLKLKLGPALKIYSHVKKLQTRQQDIELWT